MSLASKVIKNAARRGWTRVVSRFGARFVSGMADTSADAPDAHFEPKRNLYERMQRGEVDETGHESPAAEPEPEQEHGHSHDHGHSHGHE